MVPDRRIIQPPGKHRLVGRVQEVVRHLPEDEYAPGAIGERVNFNKCAVLPACPGGYHGGRRSGYRQPGAAEGIRHLVGESVPGSERMGIGFLRYLHGSQVSVMLQARLLPILLPTRRIPADAWRRLRNDARGHSHTWTAMDDLPTPTDKKVADSSGDSNGGAQPAHRTHCHHRRSRGRGLRPRAVLELIRGPWFKSRQAHPGHSGLTCDHHVAGRVTRPVPWRRSASTRTTSTQDSQHDRLSRVRPRVRPAHHRPARSRAVQLSGVPAACSQRSVIPRSHV